MVIFRVFLWIFGGEGVFVKLHVTGSPCFVICFVCLSAPVGWDFSLKHQQLNSYDLFLMPKPNHGKPVFNVHEYPWKFTTKFLCFFWNWTKCTKQSGIKMISLPETNGSQVPHLKSWKRWFIVIFLGVGTAQWTQGSCFSLQVDIHTYNPTNQYIFEGQKTLQV